MKGIPIIQKPLALLALLLFMFSATPKKFLHDLIADHQDFYAALPGEEPGISNTGFDCHIHDLVVSTPFVAPHLFAASGSTDLYTVHNTKCSDRYVVLTSLTEDSRGPPSGGN